MNRLAREHMARSPGNLSGRSDLVPPPWRDTVVTWVLGAFVLSAFGCHATVQTTADRSTTSPNKAEVEEVTLYLAGMNKRFKIL